MRRAIQRARRLRLRREGWLSIGMRPWRLGRPLVGSYWFCDMDAAHLFPLTPCEGRKENRPTELNFCQNFRV
jgi:hypothetical protein